MSPPPAIRATDPAAATGAPGPARLHPDDPARQDRRPGRAERRRQDHPAAPSPPGCSPRPPARSPSSATRRTGGRRRSCHASFLGQDAPLYRGFRVAELLTYGQRLNPRWDLALARRRLDALGIPLDRRAGALSGGQRAQVALTIALAKRTEVLLLDEPMASLDPLARREFLGGLLEAATGEGLTVVLSRTSWPSWSAPATTW